MDGSKFNTATGNEKICIGRILYFNAPIPHHILHDALEIVARRYDWKIEFKLNTIYGRGNVPVYTLCLLKNVNQYTKLLPRNEKTVHRRYRQWEELTSDEQKQIQDIRVQWKESMDRWEQLYLEMDIEDLTRQTKEIITSTYKFPFPSIPINLLTSIELNQIREMDPELITSSHVHLHPQTYQYYTPPSGSKGNNIYCSEPERLSVADRKRFHAQLKEQFNICNFWGDERYPRIESMSTKIRGRKVPIALIKFHPQSEDGITAIGFFRDCWFVDSRKQRHQLRFRYWYR